MVETYVNNVIGSVEKSLRLFADVDSPHLKLAMDPTNYFEEHNIGDMDGTLNRIFDALFFGKEYRDFRVLVGRGTEVTGWVT